MEVEKVYSEEELKKMTREEILVLLVKMVNKANLIV